MADSSTPNRPVDQGENRSVHRFRWIGYGFLLFALIDAIYTLFPPEFTNPEWNLRTIGGLVERSVVPLLGFALVFFGEFFDRKPVEKGVTTVLSWLCLLLGIGYLLMIPPGIIGTIMLNNQGAQLNPQVTQQLAALQQYEEQLNRATPAELQGLAQQLQQPGVVEQLKQQGIDVDPKKPETLKAAIQNRISTQRAQLQSQIQQAQATRGQTLVKNAVKWNLGALITSVLFFMLWRSTSWTRET